MAATHADSPLRFSSVLALLPLSQKRSVQSGADPGNRTLKKGADDLPRESGVQTSTLLPSLSTFPICSKEPQLLCTTSVYLLPLFAKCAGTSGQRRLLETIPIVV